MLCNVIFDIVTNSGKISGKDEESESLESEISLTVGFVKTEVCILIVVSLSLNLIIKIVIFLYCSQWVSHIA